MPPAKYLFQPSVVSSILGTARTQAESSEGEDLSDERGQYPRSILFLPEIPRLLARLDKVVASQNAQSASLNQRLRSRQECDLDLTFSLPTNAAVQTVRTCSTCNFGMKNQVSSAYEPSG